MHKIKFYIDEVNSINVLFDRMVKEEKEITLVDCNTMHESLLKFDFIFAEIEGEPNKINDFYIREMLILKDEQIGRYIKNICVALN